MAYFRTLSRDTLTNDFVFDLQKLLEPNLENPQQVHLILATSTCNLQARRRKE